MITLPPALFWQYRARELAVELTAAKLAQAKRAFEAACADHDAIRAELASTHGLQLSMTYRWDEARWSLVPVAPRDVGGDVDRP